MSSGNEPISEKDDNHLAPPAPEKASSKLRRSVSKLSNASSAVSAMQKPKKTASKLRKLAVRQGMITQLFFPQHDHKMHLMEEHLKKKGDDANPDDFHSDHLTLRGKIVWFIHSKRVQTFLLALLLLDVIAVIAELVIASFKECKMYTIPHSNDGLCDVGASAHLHNFAALSAGKYIAHGVTNSSGYFPPEHCGVYVTQQLSHSLHTAEQVIFWISIGILIVFALELFVLFCCLLHRFFNVVYTIDLIIVSVSLIVSFTVSEEKDHHATELIIFLRCWRFARILHGFGLTVHEVEEGEVEEKEEELEQELDVVCQDGRELLDENKQLRKIIMDLLDHEESHVIADDVMKRNNSQMLETMKQQSDCKKKERSGIFEPASSSTKDVKDDEFLPKPAE